MSKLLTRDKFRDSVFERDGHKCLFCDETSGLDAHHILERRLWPDGGYYLDNGATVCGEHHLACERTDISVEEIREAAGITSRVLPPHLYQDQRYDKWGNPVLANGQRLQGELFEDASVRKVLFDHLPSFTNKVKYPRTYHLWCSPGRTKDDRIGDAGTLRSLPEIVITEKLDGENTNLYRDGIHARSLDFAPRFDRDRVRALHGNLAHEIPEGMRICGENIWAKHSIEYDLPAFFYVFSMWEGLTCLSWDDTVEWAALLDLPTAPVLYRGPWDDKVLEDLIASWDAETREGFVVRTAEPFSLKEFPHLVLKWVRPGHVQTHAHWTRNIQPNPLRL